VSVACAHSFDFLASIQFSKCILTFYRMSYSRSGSCANPATQVQVGLPGTAIRNEARLYPSHRLSERIHGAIVTDFGTDSMPQETFEYKAITLGRHDAGLSLASMNLTDTISRLYLVLRSALAFPWRHH
jgi:hypothetical protein